LKLSFQQIKYSQRFNNFPSQNFVLKKIEKNSESFNIPENNIISVETAKGNKIPCQVPTGRIPLGQSYNT
jgi:hypothetical protein